MLKVRQISPVVEAEAILKIHLSSQCCEDIRFWHGNPKGIYTVKEGYSQEMNLMASHPFQSTQPNEAWWLKLWCLSLPPKLRIFFWRACRDLIPTPANLASMFISTCASCPLCFVGIATTSHCFIFCPMVKYVWKQSLFWVHVKTLNMVSFMECAMFIASFLSKELLELFVIMAWAV